MAGGYSNNNVAFIIGQQKEKGGAYVTQVNIDVLISKSEDCEQNIAETISTYHRVVADGIDSVISADTTSKD